MSQPRAAKKEIFGWAMFDFANQAYTLLIITVVFGDLFTRVIVGDADTGYRLGNLLWSLSLAAGYLLVVLTAPFFGAVMDLTARRKQFLLVSYLLTVAATALLYFVAPGYILLGMLLGYVGGLVATGLALLFLGEVSLENFDNVRWVGPFAATFFLLAAIPTFLWLKERGNATHINGISIWQQGWKRLEGSLRHLQGYQDLSRFLLSAMFAMSGIYIIIAFTFIYGAQVVQWDEKMRVLTFITVQVTATLGAILFGWAEDRMGSRFTYLFTLLFWITAILLIWQTPNITSWLNAQGHDLQRQDVFLYVAIAAGLCLGATQSASRAIVGKLTPQPRAAEFFGFWGLSHKLAAIIGLVGVGVMQTIVGLQNAILLCAVFFALAFVTCLKVDLNRGRLKAESYQEHSPQRQRLNV